MRTPERTLLSAGHELPLPSASPKSVVGASDQLCSVFKNDPVSGLRCLPMVQHGCDDIPPIRTLPDGPVDGITDANLCQRLRPTVSHEYRCVTRHAVDTPVGASPIGVDRVAEGHPGGGGDLVDDPFGADF
jgi:hypothetical protein